MTPPTSLIIKPVTIAELSLLRDLAESTFIEAFGPRNTAEDMQQYVAKTFNTDQVLASFRNEEINYYIAWLGTEAVAYLKLNYGTAQSEQTLSNAVEIERIYVKGGYQGKQIGAQLLRFAIEQAKGANLAWIWLGVWEQNLAAIRFYERHGFVTFGRHEFYLGSDRQMDFLMKRKL